NNNCGIALTKIHDISFSNHGKERAMGCYTKGVAYKLEGQDLYLLTKMPAVNKRRNSYINTA
ncbi:MAG: hypothetical protein MUO43_16055, partial [Desulfobacterales bacterium]|nr:hypothetical protein [Desulfobacterales bacterium]